MKKKKCKHDLGRDPACGRVAFKTGRILTRKDRRSGRKGRNDKYARRALREQLKEWSSNIKEQTWVET